jgi:hypothetical protein
MFKVASGGNGPRNTRLSIRSLCMLRASLFDGKYVGRTFFIVFAMCSNKQEWKV